MMGNAENFLCDIFEAENMKRIDNADEELSVLKIFLANATQQPF